MQSTLVATGSGAPQTDFTAEYKEGIDTLEYSPDIEFIPNAAKPFQDPIVKTTHKAKNQSFPAPEDHTISIHLVNSIAMYRDLKRIESWVDESLQTLDHALGSESVNFDNIDILNKSQKDSLARLLGRNHITFGDYKHALTDRNNMLRSYITKIWNHHFFKPDGRPDALIYSDVFRMKQMMPNLNGLAKVVLIGNSTLLGENAKLDPREQMTNFLPHIDQQKFVKDPKCFTMLVAMQDTVSALTSHMHDLASAQSQIVPTHDDIVNSSGRVVDVITSGVLKGHLSPQGIVNNHAPGQTDPIVNPSNGQTYAGPGVDFNTIPGTLDPLVTGGAQVSQSVGGLTGGVGVGISFNSAAAEQLIQEIVQVLQGLEVVILILSTNGFALIQGIEEMLDQIIDQLAEQLMMETLSIISMIQGAVLAPLSNLMFQLDLNIGPFTVNVDAWTNAASLLTSAIESVTGRFYGRLLDWYRKMLTQLNGGLNKLGSSSTNNQYGNLLAIINEIITWLQQLTFVQLNYQAGQTLNFTPQLNFSPNLQTVQQTVPPDQTPASVQEIKDRVAHKLHERYKPVAKLKNPPRLSMSYPHMQSKLSNTIAELPIGKMRFRGDRLSLAKRLISEI